VDAPLSRNLLFADCGAHEGPGPHWQGQALVRAKKSRPCGRLFALLRLVVAVVTLAWVRDGEAFLRCEEVVDADAV
jgi:hypothetical protein